MWEFDRSFEMERAEPKSCEVLTHDESWIAFKSIIILSIMFTFNVSSYITLYGNQRWLSPGLPQYCENPRTSSERAPAQET